MDSFEYNANPSRVIFGSGSIKELPAELARLEKKAAIVLTTSHQKHLVDDIRHLLGEKLATEFTEAAMHTPTDVTERAVQHATSKGVDSIISIGGGSTIGLGKAMSIRMDLPHICIATTYAGSEMTPILGETADGVKKTRSNPKILPGVVIYDVDYTLTLPPGMSATSGINAIAHAVEALYAPNANPIVTLHALEGVKALAGALPLIVKDPSSLEARTKALYGAWLCGSCLGSVGMSLHHKLCHTLGGSLNLPHAETHTIVLPHALSYNAPKIPKVMDQLAEVFPGSEGDALKGLSKLLASLHVKLGLKELGMEESGIAKAAEIATQNPYANPRPIEKEGIQEVIRRAWAGEAPKADI